MTEEKKDTIEDKAEASGAIKAFETITLSIPVTYNNITYTEVTVTRPKVKDFKRVDFGKNTVEENLKIATALTKIPTLALEEFDFVDYAKIMDVVGDFFTNSPVVKSL